MPSWSPLRTLAAHVLLLLAAPICQAAIYFVDQDKGRDSNDGLSASQATTTAQFPARGPWQTLSKVTTAPLQPGDQVLLRCGQTWNESLVLNRGGTQVQPVLVGAFPYACSNKPVVGGFLTPQADEWDRVSGNVYKVKLPLSVLPFGRMQAGATGWTVSTTSAALLHRAQCNDGAPCAEFVGTPVASGQAGGSALSPAMSLTQGRTYTVRLKVFAPAGSMFSVTVRRFQLPNAAQSQTMAWTGRGTWQTHSLDFVAPASIDDARIDISFPGGGRSSFFRDVRVEPNQTNMEVRHVTSSTGVMNLAAHPNRGHDASQPQSVYLRAAASAVERGADGRLGSRWLAPLADHKLPPGAALAPGIDVWLRSQSWSLRKLPVTAVQGNALQLGELTPYPLSVAGWGYFLTGARWMLDSPGEWFYDRNSRELSVWMPDGQAPGNRIGLGTLARAATIGNPSNGTFANHITLENLAFVGAAEGLMISRMKNISLRRVDVTDIGSWGVMGDGAHGLRVEQSKFKRTRADAILAVSSNDTYIADNSIVESGVLVDEAGTVKSLPRENYAAVLVGARAQLLANTVSYVGNNGLITLSDSVIRDNLLRSVALNFSDSGAIYLGGAQQVTIQGNLVKDAVGDNNGTPAGMAGAVSGVYLDDNTAGALVKSNTVAGGDHCVKVHNGASHTVQDNTCFGQDESALKLHEDTALRRAAGDIWGNVFTSNVLFQTNLRPAVTLHSSKAGVDDFASFDGNLYSGLSSLFVAQESSPGARRLYPLSEWKLATTSAGPRRLETNGKTAAPLQGLAPGLLSADLVPDMLQAGWSLSGGGISFMGAQCGPNYSSCMFYVAPTAAAGYFSSPRFNLTKGRSYRVSFDAAVGRPGQPFMLMAMRSGPTYENLMGGEPMELTGTLGWKRFSFVFKATATASLANGGRGARIDVMNVPAGAQMSLANFEVAELSSPSIETRSFLLSNDQRATALLQCPVTGVACGKFFDAKSGQRVNWPVSLAPLASKVVVVQSDEYPDQDSDGIADSQDLCPQTAVASSTLSNGCSLVQR